MRNKQRIYGIAATVLFHLLILLALFSNAAGLGQEYCRELLRVIIHGVLHLCGIDDKGPGEREIMESHENAALAMWDALS